MLRIVLPSAGAAQIKMCVLTTRCGCCASQFNGTSCSVFDCGRAQGRGRRGSSPRATGRHYVGLPRSVDDRTGGPFRNINRRVPASVFPPPLVGLTRARHGPHHARARDQMQLSLPPPS